MKEYYKDPMSGLWLPTDWVEFEAGYKQTKSGLWVPESCAKQEWTTQYTNAVKKDCCELKATLKADASTFNEKSEQLKQAVDGAVLKHMKQISGKINEMAAKKIEMSMKYDVNLLPKVQTMATAGVFQSSPSREELERNRLKRYFVDVLDIDNEAAGRLAELLWLGTEVCCLNLRRRNEAWRARIKQGHRG